MEKKTVSIRAGIGRVPNRLDGLVRTSSSSLVKAPMSNWLPYMSSISSARASVRLLTAGRLAICSGVCVVTYARTHILVAAVRVHVRFKSDR